ncbi:MAG TPA: tRNA 2-selenouridine(34) synthase MnmH [Desulfobacteria bacterium]|nr:tRNA 2-selenouridine(34) synthase MnmH [Desulfobacteria bacterium]
MSNEITVHEALAMPGAKLIDVRSELEFAEATLPGAFNIPLLRDEERATVGTAYKHEGVDIARRYGLNFVAPRLPQLVQQFREISGESPLVVFCWRGGMRSKSMCSVLESVGIPVYRLIGGYKAYRRYVNEYLDRPLPHEVVVIHGLTGVGKTELLQELRQMELPSVDLEGLASNRGSVFGQIGLEPQPSQKMFDGLLVRELAFWESVGYIIVECESKRIGRIVLPESLVHGMRSAVRILAYSSVEARTERIIRIYGGNSDKNLEDLKAAVSSLIQRLGRNKVAELNEMLDNGDINQVVQFLLISSYDPLYKYPSQPSNEYDLSVNTDDIKTAAEKIKDFLRAKKPR